MELVEFDKTNTDKAVDTSVTLLPLVNGDFCNGDSGELFARILIEVLDVADLVAVWGGMK